MFPGRPAYRAILLVWYPTPPYGMNVVPLAECGFHRYIKNHGKADTASVASAEARADWNGWDHTACLEAIAKPIR